MLPSPSITQWECPRCGTRATFATVREGSPWVCSCHPGIPPVERTYVAVDALLSELEDAGDGSLDRPWNPDFLVKWVKGLRALGVESDG